MYSTPHDQNSSAWARAQQFAAERLAGEVHCPGCSAVITVQNAGMYRTYCEDCTSVIPWDELPSDFGGFLVGRRGSFRWMPVCKP